MYFQKSICPTVLLLCASFALTACGKKGEFQLSNVDLGVNQVDQRTFVNFEAEVKMGNLKLPNVELPILNPKTMTSFGQLALVNDVNGVNKMLVSIDFETAIRLDPTLGQTLPNGREIPLLLGAQNTTLIGIPILKSSRIYVGGDLRSDLYLGAALTVNAFDSVLNQVSMPLNIFSKFQFSNNVTAVGGIFTSPNAGQNGIGVFVKKSAKTGTVTVLSAGRSSVAARASTTGRTAAATTVSRSEATEFNKLNYSTLYDLNTLFNKRATVRIK